MNRTIHCIIFEILLILISGSNAISQTGGQIIRLAEISLHPGLSKDYNKILKEEAAAPVRLGPGMIAIYPMQLKDQSDQIRIVEIYKNQAAYRAHLKTPHFQKYKSGTVKMIKSLKLTGMNAIHPRSMKSIFSKIDHTTQPKIATP